MSDDFIVIWGGDSDSNLPAEMVPDVAYVAQFLLARTKDSNGVQLGTFNENTRPTADQVQGFIDKALDAIRLRVGTRPVPNGAYDLVRLVVGLRAAYTAEASLQPDSIGDDDSLYARLKAEYTESLSDLLDILADSDSGTTRRIASVDVVSPTLAPYPAEIRELIAPAWPIP